jgi:hypothetical protein
VFIYEYNSFLSIKTVANSDYDSSKTVECGVFHIFGFDSENWYKMYKWNEIRIAIKTAARNKMEAVLPGKFYFSLRNKSV